MAPPVDFLEKSYLPLVNRMGPSVEMHLVRPGFYPAGGGQFTVRVQPAKNLRPLEVHRSRPDNRPPGTRPGGPTASTYRRARVPDHRRGDGLGAASFTIDEVKNSRGPGNAVMIELKSEHITEVFTAFGRLGVRAEDVATEALCQANEYLASGMPVGMHLADQLMLPLGIAAYLGAGGSAFRTTGLSLHAMTHLEILRSFWRSPSTWIPRTMTTAWYGLANGTRTDNGIPEISADAFRVSGAIGRQQQPALVPGEQGAVRERGPGARDGLHPRLPAPAEADLAVLRGQRPAGRGFAHAGLPRHAVRQGRRAVQDERRHPVPARTGPRHPCARASTSTSRRASASWPWAYGGPNPSRSARSGRRSSSGPTVGGGHATTGSSESDSRWTATA